MIKYNSSEIIECYLGNNMLDSIYLGSNLIWSAAQDYSTMPLTIESLEDYNTITIKSNGFTGPIIMIINFPWGDDNQIWIEPNTTYDIITLNRGDKIQIKGGWPTTCTNSNYLTIGSSGTFNVYGNIMSVFGENNGSYITTIPSTYQFTRLFNNSKVVDASNLILPATTLTNYCYRSMFNGCTSLTTAPELPATTLADYCYNYMFNGCTSLTTAPELPATTLADYCYQQMFYGCTSLTTAPELPATTLAAWCYYQMFYGCTSLTTAPELPATTLANGCYHSMLYNTNVLPDCTNIDFTSSTIISSGGLRGLFAGTKVTDNDLMNILPKNSSNKYCLPVTTLAANCYRHMFQKCTSLTTAPELPATTLANYCYGNMFNDCTSLTSVPSILPATTLADYCYYYMFCGCKSLTTAPVLPATTLVSNCYNSMLRDCNSLNYIKALFTTKPSSDYTYYWVFRVGSTGTFVKNTSATWTMTSVNGVPSGWTIQYASS